MSDPKAVSREEEVLQEVTEILRRRLAPRRILLFGSRAKGRAAPHADFDLAVEARRPPAEEAFALRETVAAAGGLYKIDLVFLDEVDDAFREMILRTGRVIHERD